MTGSGAPAVETAGPRRGGAWSIVVSSLGWALGLAGVLVPVLSAELLAEANVTVAILAGSGMLLANVASLVMAVVARRRAKSPADRGAATAGLVASILGVLGGLGVAGFGALLLLGWAMVSAAAVSL
jgi:hypothetical protein